MKIFPKREMLIISLLLFSLVSCKKSTDSRITEFVFAYRNSFAAVANSNPYIVSSSAEKTSANEVTIRFYTKSTEETSMESDLLRKSLPEIVGTAILQEPSSKQLINDGVKFNVKILDEGGQNVLYSKVFDKESVGKSPATNNTGTPGIAQILDGFNKNLPVTDPSTGIKIVKIEAGDDQDIIYKAIVPPNMAELFKSDGAKELLKEELLRSPQIKDILMRSENFGISKLKYKYMDEKENLITEISISKADLKL